MTAESSESTPGVLFVCLGNICRSPTAEAVLTRQVAEAGLAGRVRVDSAGTHGYHLGKPPDRRAAEAARARGYDLSGLRARQATAEDLAAFDYVLAMDRGNLEVLEALRGGDARAELGLLLDYLDEPGEREVPDPYYGGANGFERVLDMVEEANRALLRRIRARHGL